MYLHDALAAHSIAQTVLVYAGSVFLFLLIATSNVLVISELNGDPSFSASWTKQTSSVTCHSVE